MLKPKPYFVPYLCLFENAPKKRKLVIREKECIANPLENKCDTCIGKILRFSGPCR